MIARSLPIQHELLASSSTLDKFASQQTSVRQGVHAEELRAHLAETHASILAGDLSHRSALSAEFDRIVSALPVERRIERGIKRRSLTRRAPVAVCSIRSEGDDTRLMPSIPSLLYRLFLFNKRYRGFLRDRLVNLGAPSWHGALKTKLNSWASPPDSRDSSSRAFDLQQHQRPSLHDRELGRHDRMFEIGFAFHP